MDHVFIPSWKVGRSTILIQISKPSVGHIKIHFQPTLQETVKLAQMHTSFLRHVVVLWLVYALWLNLSKGMIVWPYLIVNVWWEQEVFFSKGWGVLVNKRYPDCISLFQVFWENEIWMFEVWIWRELRLIFTSWKHFMFNQNHIMKLHK